MQSLQLSCTPAVVVTCSYQWNSRGGSGGTNYLKMLMWINFLKAVVSFKDLIVDHSFQSFQAHDWLWKPTNISSCSINFRQCLLYFLWYYVKLMHNGLCLDSPLSLASIRMHIDLPPLSLSHTPTRKPYVFYSFSYNKIPYTNISITWASNSLKTTLAVLKFSLAMVVNILIVPCLPLITTSFTALLMLSFISVNDNVLSF